MVPKIVDTSINKERRKGEWFRKASRSASEYRGPVFYFVYPSDRKKQTSLLIYGERG